jgi:hypothetical protein
MMGSIYVIGDIHGEYDKLARLLKDAGLIDDTLHWSGGYTALWFLGDFVDRGPDGVGVVDLVMRLQAEAEEAGGKVGALLGNHEPVILSALWLPDQPCGGPGGTFYSNWKFNGGIDTDLGRLTARHTEWLTALPALARVGDWLLMHANSSAYTRYGSTIEEANAAFSQVLHGRAVAAWDRLTGDFNREFGDHKPDGHEKVSLVLDTYGAKRLVHGHTIISNWTKQPPESVTGALVYDGGRCVNVDAGMFEGSPGFLYKLPLV